KGHFLAPAVEIPLVVRPPRRDGTTPSFVSGALVELMDVGATILDYAGLPVPAWSNARSLRLVLERRTEVHRDFVLSEFIHHTMIANQRWKAEFAPNGAAVLLFDAAESEEHTNLVHRMNAESA